VFYAGKQVDVFAIGKKGNDVLVKTSVVIDNQSAVYDDLTFDNVAVIADALMEKFVSGDYDKIELIYNHLKNAATQIVQTEQFLPLAAVQSDLTASVGDILNRPKKRLS
jgi:F-type H+-transporting ATPase subunit gamma